MGVVPVQDEMIIKRSQRENWLLALKRQSSYLRFM